MQPEKKSMSMRPKFTSVRGAGGGIGLVGNEKKISWEKEKSFLRSP
jgi:hypothetical protein